MMRKDEKLLNEFNKGEIVNEEALNDFMKLLDDNDPEAQELFEALMKL